MIKGFWQRTSGLLRGVLRRPQLPAEASLRLRRGDNQQAMRSSGCEDGERLRELARRRTEFERIIGHELRSPLDTISLSADVLEISGCFDDEALRRRQLSAIRSAVRQASELLIDLDLLVMMEHGACNPTPMAPLAEVMQAVREELAMRADAAGVDLIFGSPPPRLFVERVVARLALSNLVNNALKYRDRAKSKRWVRVSAQAAHGSVVVEVADNGIGIESELQERVFDRHFRARPELAEGSGLGLAITREVLTGRGGRIDLRSEESVGTTVRMRLLAESRALAAVSPDPDSSEAVPRAAPLRGQMT